MANKYFNWPGSLRRFVRFDAARSEDVNDALDEVSTAMDGVETDTKRSIKLPASGTDQLLNLSPAQRANLVMGFDPSGAIAALPGGGRFTGDWAAGKAYLVSETFRDPSSKNIYSASVAHTSTTIASDLVASKIRLAISVVDVELAKDAAAASAGVAAQQAGLATTNGAAQVALATAQATLATSQADAARAIANFVGVWSTLTGSLNKPATVYHAGLFYVLVNSLSNVALSEPGVTADWIAAGGGMPSYTYEQRGDLRASGGQFAVVDGLGLFQHVTASTEPDDDESCFATATGRWLLQAAHWDLIDAWQLPEVEERDAYDEDEPLRFAASFAASFASKVLTGSATCAITSVAAVASTSFTGTVTGAAVGDRVIATPPAQLGSNATETGKLSYHTWVSAANTVTVMLTNASAAAATTNTAVQTAWPITVIKP